MIPTRSTKKKCCLSVSSFYPDHICLHALTFSFVEFEFVCVTCKVSECHVHIIGPVYFLCRSVCHVLAHRLEAQSSGAHPQAADPLVHPSVAGSPRPRPFAGPARIPQLASRAGRRIVDLAHLDTACTQSTWPKATAVSTSPVVLVFGPHGNDRIIKNLSLHMTFFM